MKHDQHDGGTAWWGTKEAAQARVLTGLFFAGIAMILFMPVFSHVPWLLFVQDDLLYYLKVAQNIADGHHSTFNGIVATNGFQPLWLILLVLFRWTTTNSRAFMAFLATANLFAALSTFLLSRKLLKTSGASPLLIFVFSAWVTIYAVTLFFYGMEVTLTVPLMLGVLCLIRQISWIEQSWTHALVLGFALSAMVLSRIDTLIFGGLILCGVVAISSLRRMIRMDLMAGILIGLLPVALYFMFNHVVFHTWLPVSGMAKELKHDRLPSLEPWKVFFHPLAAAFSVLIVVSLGRLYRIRERLPPIDRVIFAATLLFPFMYYFVLSCVSDWTLWGWYMYPIRAAVCVSFAICLEWRSFRELLQRRAVQMVLIASVFACLCLLRWTRQQPDIYAASLQIQGFAQTHPGIYAMGDRAGRVGYLIPNPVVQTEGLMMDRDYLRYVERETPLRETLAHYNVRYYVATAYGPYSGCFKAVEPAKAGPQSAKMRATFCQDPEAVYVHDDIKTMIFDLTKE